MLVPVEIRRRPNDGDRTLKTRDARQFASRNGDNLKKSLHYPLGVCGRSCRARAGGRAGEADLRIHRDYLHAHTCIQIDTYMHADVHLVTQSRR